MKSTDHVEFCCNWNIGFKAFSRDGRTNGRTDRRTDRHTDRPTDEPMDTTSYIHAWSHLRIAKFVVPNYREGRTDEQTDGKTDGWTDRRTVGQTDKKTLPLTEMRCNLKQPRQFLLQFTSFAAPLLLP